MNRTSSMSWYLATLIAGTVTATSLAQAQPLPRLPDDYPAGGDGSGSGSGATPAPPTGTAPATPTGTAPTGVPPTPAGPTAPGDTWVPPGAEADAETPATTSTAPAPPAAKPEPPRPPIDQPQVITTPTGWLLPAAVLYSRLAIDTGGGVTSDNRVGLGDVAELGLSTTDQVRARADASSPTSRIQPYVTATFRMGVAERRLFDAQPGIVLGFRKSFERNHDNYATRIAELTLVASKHVGSRAAFHVGGAFWDASLRGPGVDTTLHDAGTLADQIRVFGGLQVRPLDRSEILLDVGWAPEFCYGCAAGDQIKLRPELSWGVRYHVAPWMLLESGVRVPDIGDANLLDAQIFGQATFTSWALRRVVDDLK